MNGRDDRPSGAFLWFIGAVVAVCVILLTAGVFWVVLS